MRPTNLTRLTLAYLLLPILIFVGGWLQPWLAAPVLALIVIVYLQVSHPWTERSPSWRSLLTHRATWVLCGVALVLTMLSRAGQFAGDTIDHAKHAVMLKELFESPWPVSYRFTLNGAPIELSLIYYLAYYLPAALIGKLSGSWMLLNVCLFAWTFLGFLLCLTWVLRLSGSLVGPLIFVAFSGADILFAPTYHLGDHIEWWSNWWQYSSHLTQVCWVPQHCIGSWLGASLFWHFRSERRLVEYGRWLIPSLAFWTPFGALGLVPFFLVETPKARRALLEPWGMTLALCLGLLGATYFSAHLSGIPHYWIWQMKPGLAWLRPYVLFTAVEWGLLAAAIYGMGNKLKGDTWWWVVVLSLAFFPLHLVGIHNDFTMRCSIPALFFLSLYVANRLLAKKQQALRWAAVGWLAIGSATGLSEAYRSFLRPPIRTISLESSPDLRSLNRYITQYLGREDAVFFKYFAKTGVPRQEWDLGDSNVASETLRRALSETHR